METTVYADVLFFVNFSMDFISIWAASKLCSQERRAGKMCLGAALGALYGVLAVIFGLEGVYAYISAGAVSVLMCLVSFGMPGGIFGLLRESAVIWGGGALLGGIMTAVLSMFSSGAEQTGQLSHSGKGVTVILFSAAVLFATVRLFIRTSSAKTVGITMTYRGESISFTALCDSGNLLRDPISGDPVMTVSKELMLPLMGRELCDSLCALSTDIEKLPRGFRLIPRKTATGSDICAAFLPDRIILKNKKSATVRCLVTAVSCPKDHFGGYPAVFPACAVK